MRRSSWKFYTLLAKFVINNSRNLLLLLLLLHPKEILGFVAPVARICLACCINYILNISAAWELSGKQSTSHTTDNEIVIAIRVANHYIASWLFHITRGVPFIKVRVSYFGTCCKLQYNNDQYFINVLCRKKTLTMLWQGYERKMVFVNPMIYYPKQK